MKLIVDAIFQNGVFVPTAAPALAEQDRVRLTIETVETVATPNLKMLEMIQNRRKNRLVVDEDLAREIATSPEFDLLDAP